jgi:hypothetical protein
MGRILVRLPKPKLGRGGTSFAEALRLRRTTREIAAAPLSEQVLSNALYAACGVNRVRGPFGARGLTAASASNSQEVDVYVLVAQGAFRFDAHEHALVAVTREDVRLAAFTPGQPLISPDAPVQLVYVVDLEKLEHTKGFEEPGLHDPEVQKSYYFVDTGLIAGNVYLYAASAGLACWFHNCDTRALGKKLRLKKTQRVLFAQTLGRERSA